MRRARWPGRPPDSPIAGPGIRLLDRSSTTSCRQCLRGPQQQAAETGEQATPGPGRRPADLSVHRSEISASCLEIILAQAAPVTTVGGGGKRPKHPSGPAQEAVEELEQHQAGGLDGNHQPLQQNDKQITQDHDQQSPRHGAGGVGHGDHRGGQGGMGQGEGADPREREGVDQDLQLPPPAGDPGPPGCPATLRLTTKLPTRYQDSPSRTGQTVSAPTPGR